MTADKYDGGQVVLFNQSIPNDTTSTGPRNKTISEKGWEGYGISFRLIKDFSQPDNWWTLRVSLWYPVIFFAILPAIYCLKKLRSQKI